MKTKIDAILQVRAGYGNHPCGNKFCRCGWIMLPPAYPGDFWDCTNPKCGKSIPSTATQIKKMQNRR